jgi:hypothetical protein
MDAVQSGLNDGRTAASRNSEIGTMTTADEVPEIDRRMNAEIK